MNAVRIICADEGSRDCVLSILRSAVCEVPGAAGRPTIEFPGHDSETARPVRVEARPHGERGVEIALVQESARHTIYG